ncbi:MAG: sulfatase, partial [Planctomycetales bacterium]|nr:sulfatase [Planctomycetales bacterium]
MRTITLTPLALAVLLAVVFASSTLRAAAPSRPNLLFILVDDLGWSDLGCYGADLHETPHIDRLADQSVRFTQAYAAAPVCSPTRASIMTGQWPARLHMTIWHEGALSSPNPNRPWLEAKAEHNLPLQHHTLAEALRDAGYRTWHIGKWHLGDAAHYPEAQGFDLNIGGTFWGAPSTFWHPFRGHWGRQRERPDPAAEIRYVPGLRGGKEGDYLPDRLTDEAIQLIEQSDETPFYLNLWYHTVHTPIEGKPDLVKKYSAKLKPSHRHRNAAYAAMVENMDQNVGRVLSALERSGKADNTLVIFFSDNGGFINEYNGEQVTNNHPLRSGKGSLYEGGIREPLLIRWPGVTRPGDCQHPVISNDFYPTLAELLKLDTAGQPSTDGVSLAPLLKNPASGLSRDTLYWHYPHYYPTTTPVSAIRHGDWKLLYYYAEDRAELFHLGDDRRE